MKSLVNRFIYRMLISFVFLKNRLHGVRVNHYGSLYGGWYFASKLIDDKSIIYSFGIGEDISFDQQIIKEKNATIYGFDPTPRSWEYISNINLSNFYLYKFGISDYDCIKKFYAPENKEHVSFSTFSNNNNDSIDAQFYCLDTILKKLNHTNIDLLKLDIEGEEFNVLENIIRNLIRPKQILVEFHPEKSSAFQSKHFDTIKKLKKLGYKLVYFSNGYRECSFYFSS